MRADSLVQLSVKRRTEFQRKSKAQSKQNRVKITAKSSLRPGTFLKGVVTRGEEVMWKEKEKGAACFLNLLQRRMNQRARWQIDRNPFMRVCVWGGQDELTVVLFLLICCVTQMGVYPCHKLSLWRRARREHAANYATMSSLHRSVLGSLTSFHTVCLWIMVHSARHCKWLGAKHKYHGLEQHNQLLFLI